MRERTKQFNLRLTEEELEQAQQLAAASDRSINSYIRSLIRREVNKSVVDLPIKKAKKQEAEYV